MAETGAIHTPQVVGRCAGVGWEAAGSGRECGVEGSEGQAWGCAGIGGKLGRRSCVGRDLGAAAPRHIVSDGDKAIESAIDMAYGKGDSRHLCQFHMLCKYKRNIGKVGFSEGKSVAWLADMEQARAYAGRMLALTSGKSLYWRVKALGKGMTHLRTSKTRYHAT